MNELLDGLDEEQTHCYTCGKKLGPAAVTCPICEELQCSEECLKKHMECMGSPV